MKRSEMIRRLMVDVNAIRSTKLNEASDELLATALLWRVEQYGMLPPDIEYQAPEIGPVFEWEPEDETGQSTR